MWPTVFDNDLWYCLYLLTKKSTTIAFSKWFSTLFMHTSASPKKAPIQARRGIPRVLIPPSIFISPAQKQQRVHPSLNIDLWHVVVFGGRRLFKQDNNSIYFCFFLSSFSFFFARRAAILSAFFFSFSSCMAISLGITLATNSFLNAV